MADVFTNEELRTMNTLITQLRDDVEGKTKLSEEQITNFNKKLDDLEVKNQELVLEKVKAQKEAKEQAEKIERLEKNLIDLSQVKLVSGTASGKYGFKETNEYKALNEYAKKGFEGVNVAQLEYKDYLRTDVGPQGGFLVPAQMATFILNEIQEISNVRAVSGGITINGKTLEIPIGVGIPKAPFEKEIEEGTYSTPTYKSETLTAFPQQTTIPITRDMLSFSAFDMTSEITSKAIKAFAKEEGNQFLVGTGVKSPFGILNSPGIETLDTVTSNVISIDDVIALSGLTKSGYNEIYFFNKKTLTELRLERNSVTGDYAWQIGGSTMPTEINGYNYLVFPDMPDRAANSLSVGFGDLSEGYLILDSIVMSMLRDEYTGKNKRVIEFTFYKYTTGKVVMEEAIKLLKTKA